MKVEVTIVGLQTVAPSIFRDKKEKDQLKEDLKRMGCEGLIAEPWGLKSRNMVHEFLRPHTNQWENTIRRLPEKWIVDSWADVYGFRKEGRIVAGRTNR